MPHFNTAVVDVCVVMAAAGKCEIICVKLIMEHGNIPEAIYYKILGVKIFLMKHINGCKNSEM